MGKVNQMNKITKQSRIFNFDELVLEELAVNAPGKRVLLVRAVLRLWRDGRVQIGLISLLLKL